MKTNLTALKDRNVINKDEFVESNMHRIDVLAELQLDILLEIETLSVKANKNEPDSERWLAYGVSYSIEKLMTLNEMIREIACEVEDEVGEEF